MSGNVGGTILAEADVGIPVSLPVRLIGLNTPRLLAAATGHMFSDVVGMILAKAECQDLWVARFLQGKM